VSGMPNFHFAGDAGVKTQTVESVIGAGVYHLSELHDRAVALYNTGAMLRQRILTQINTLRSRRDDYRSLASTVAMLVAIAEVADASDQDLEKILKSADAQAPLPPGRAPGNLTQDIVQSLNGYGGGMILGQLAVRLGLLTKKGLVKALQGLAPEAVEGLPEALADAGVSVAEPTAREATTEVAEAFGTEAAESLSAASVVAAGVGFLVTAGIDIGLGWASAKQNADALNNAITDYQAKINKLTSYSRTVTDLYNKTYASVGAEQNRVNTILSALARVFGPVVPVLPEPDPTRVSETLRVAYKATRHYGVYADVRCAWQKWLKGPNGDRPDTAARFIQWYIQQVPPSINQEEIASCVEILRRNSDSFAQAESRTP
jgi:hypothetical protein